MKVFVALMLALLVLSGCSEVSNVGPKNSVTVDNGIINLGKGESINLRNSSVDPDGGEIKYSWFLYQFETTSEKLSSSEWTLLGNAIGAPNMEITGEGGYYKFGLCSIDELGAIGCDKVELYGVLKDHNYFDLYKSLPEMKDLIPRNALTEDGTVIFQ